MLLDISKMVADPTKSAEKLLARLHEPGVEELAASIVKGMTGHGMGICGAALAMARVSVLYQLLVDNRNAVRALAIDDTLMQRGLAQIMVEEALGVVSLACAQYNTERRAADATIADPN